MKEVEQWLSAHNDVTKDPGANDDDVNDSVPAASCQNTDDTESKILLTSSAVGRTAADS